MDSYYSIKKFHETILILCCRFGIRFTNVYSIIVLTEDFDKILSPDS